MSHHSTKIYALTEDLEKKKKKKKERKKMVMINVSHEGVMRW